MWIRIPTSFPHPPPLFPSPSCIHGKGGAGQGRAPSRQRPTLGCPLAASPLPHIYIGGRGGEAARGALGLAPAPRGHALPCAPFPCMHDGEGKRGGVREGSGNPNSHIPFPSPLSFSSSYSLIGRTSPLWAGVFLHKAHMAHRIAEGTRNTFR